MVTDVQVQINSELCWQGWNPGLISSLPEKSSLEGGGGLFWLQVHHGREGMATGEGGSWSCCLCHREPESDEGPCSAHFLLPLSETLAHGMGQPVLTAGLPTSISQTDFASQIGPGVWGPSVLTLTFLSCQPGGGSWKGKIIVIVLTKVTAD